MKHEKSRFPHPRRAIVMSWVSVALRSLLVVELIGRLASSLARLLAQRRQSARLAASLIHFTLFSSPLSLPLSYFPLRMLYAFISPLCSVTSESSASFADDPARSKSIRNHRPKLPTLGLMMWPLDCSSRLAATNPRNHLPRQACSESERWNWGKNHNSSFLARPMLAYQIATFLA